MAPGALQAARRASSVPLGPSRPPRGLPAAALCRARGRQTRGFGSGPEGTQHSRPLPVHSQRVPGSREQGSFEGEPLGFQFLPRLEVWVPQKVWPGQRVAWTASPATHRPASGAEPEELLFSLGWAGMLTPASLLGLDGCGASRRVGSLLQPGLGRQSNCFLSFFF